MQQNMITGATLEAYIRCCRDTKPEAVNFRMEHIVLVVASLSYQKMDCNGECTRRVQRKLKQRSMQWPGEYENCNQCHELENGV